MDINLDLFTLLKMGLKLARHKAQQYRYATNESQVRCTKNGQVRGIKRRTIYDGCFYAFEGIPYAKPPLGDLRFRAPQPAEPWSDIKDCTTYKNKPLQKDMFLPITEGSEDCLYLNVYARKLESPKPLPVIVWIYGGGFQIGEANRDLYAPDYIMQHDVILVSIAYRLNAFGFLSLNDADIGVPGNAGLKDQIMALKWIKENISNFNGDPENVTVLGESAGAASCHILMCSPQAKGLFHKAILLSGTGLCPWSIAPQRNWPFRLACNLGYQGTNNDKEIFRFLIKADGSRIAHASNSLISKEERRENIFLPFVPTIEPYESEDSVITRPFLEMIRNSWGNEIPVLLGGTSFEGLLFYRVPKRSPYVVDDLGNCENMVPHEARLGKSPEEITQMGRELKKFYFNNETPEAEKHFYHYLTLSSFQTIWHGIYRTILGRLKYAKAAPTFVYRFDFDSPFFNHYRILNCGPNERGVSHADDLSYLFFNVLATKLSPTTPEYTTIERMTSMVVGFARDAKPNSGTLGSIKWEPICSSEGNEENEIKCLNIGHDLEMMSLPGRDHFEVWNKFYTKDSLV